MMNASPPSRARKILGHGSVFFSGLAYTAVLSFAVKVYAARHLGAELLGQMALLLVISSVGASSLGLGLHQALARFTAVFHATDRELVSKGTFSLALIVLSILGLAGAVACFVLAESIARSGTDAPGATYIRVISILIPTTMISGALSSYLRGRQEVGRQTLITSFFQLTLRAVILIAMVEKGAGLWALVAAEVGSAIATAMLLGVAVKRMLPVGPARLEIPQEVKTYSASMYCLGWLQSISSQFGRIVLAVALDADTLGLFAVAVTVSAFVPITLSAVNSIFGPIIAEVHARGDTATLGRLFKDAALWCTIFTTPIVIAVVAAQQQIMGIFGSEFELAGMALACLAIGELVNVSVGSVGNLLIMTGNERCEVSVRVLLATIHIVGHLTITLEFGLTGAAIVTATGNAVANLARAWWVHRRLGLLPFSSRQFGVLGYGLLVTIAIRSVLGAMPNGQPFLAALAAGSLAAISFLPFAHEFWKRVRWQ